MPAKVRIIEHATGKIKGIGLPRLGDLPDTLLRDMHASPVAHCDFIVLGWPRLARASAQTTWVGCTSGPICFKAK